MNNVTTTMLSVDSPMRLVISSDNEVTAAAQLCVLKNDLHRRPFGLVEKVYFDKYLAYGRGKDKKLLETVALAAQHNNCYKFVLLTEKHDWCVRNIAKKAGFQDHGVYFKLPLVNFNVPYNEIKSYGVRFSITKQDKEMARARLYVINNGGLQPFGFMEDVYVDETVRGQGYGTTILETLIDKAQQSACYALLATSRYERKKVHELYGRFGFRVAGKEMRKDLDMLI